jgi:hypothetical protein
MLKSTGMAICAVCGSEFDQSRYQVLAPSLQAQPFDKVECAEAAMLETTLLRAARRRRRASGGSEGSLSGEAGAEAPATGDPPPAGRAVLPVPMRGAG